MWLACSYSCCLLLEWLSPSGLRQSFRRLRQSLRHQRKKEARLDSSLHSARAAEDRSGFSTIVKIPVAYPALGHDVFDRGLPVKGQGLRFEVSGGVPGMSKLAAASGDVQKVTGSPRVCRSSWRLAMSWRRSFYQKTCARQRSEDDEHGDADEQGALINPKKVHPSDQRIQQIECSEGQDT